MDVVAVDLDIHADPEEYESMPCYCDEIRRIPTGTLYKLPSNPATTILLFCYGRRCPLQAYLKQYPTLAAVAIIGDLQHRDPSNAASTTSTNTSSVTQPTADALVGDAAWNLTCTQGMRGSLLPPDCMAYLYTRAVVGSGGGGGGGGRAIY